MRSLSAAAISVGKGYDTVRALHSERDFMSMTGEWWLTATSPPIHRMWSDGFRALEDRTTESWDKTVMENIKV